MSKTTIKKATAKKKKDPIDNLIPFNEQSESEVKKKARKGGIKSGEVRRQRKGLKNVLSELLSKEITSNKAKAQLKELGFSEEEINNEILMSVAIFQKAIKGDTRAFEIIRDTIGEKPKEEKKTPKNEEKELSTEPIKKEEYVIKKDAYYKIYIKAGEKLIIEKLG